jgi:hypothetical protein
MLRLEKKSVHFYWLWLHQNSSRLRLRNSDSTALVITYHYSLSFACLRMSLHLQLLSASSGYLPTFLQSSDLHSEILLAVSSCSQRCLIQLMTTFLCLLDGVGSLRFLTTIGCHLLSAAFCINVDHPISCPHMQLISGRKVTSNSSVG